MTLLKNIITFFEILFGFFFILYLINYQQSDYYLNQLFHFLSIDNDIELVTFICGLLIISLIILPYSNFIAGIIFIVVFITMKTNLKYNNITNRVIREFFNNPTPTSMISNQNGNSDDRENISDEEDVERVKDYLKKQVRLNPNITTLEKDIIQEIYDTYFLESDKIKLLKRFNENAAKQYNPINEHQKPLGIMDFLPQSN